MQVFTIQFRIFPFSSSYNLT